MASFSVKECRLLPKKLRGTDEHKQRFVVSNESDNSKCVVLLWKNTPCIIYDFELDEILSNHNWSYHAATGYAYVHVDEQRVYLHSMVAAELNLMQNADRHESIDHVNYQAKTDNRGKNLRVATQSQQNHNRGERKDRKAPIPELQACGVTEMPRHVRWDNTEQKFIIEKHPWLIKLKDDGVINKSHKSCMKRRLSTSDSDEKRQQVRMEQYQDALTTIQEYDEKIETDDSRQFTLLQRTLRQEFDAITRVCVEYALQHLQL